MALFGDLSLSGRKLIVSLALVIVIKLLLDAYFHTKSGLLLRGQKVMCIGFGAGLTWGGALLEW